MSIEQYKKCQEPYYTYEYFKNKDKHVKSTSWKMGQKSETQ
jgi:hypothetical protein